MGENLPLPWCNPFCINRTNNALAAKLICRLADNIGIGNSSGIKANFVCACKQKIAYILYVPNTTTNCQWNITLLCGTLYHFKNGITVFICSLNVKETNFIRASSVVSSRSFNRITRITKTNKIYTFYYSSISNIQTRYDTRFKHSKSPKPSIDLSRHRKAHGQRLRHLDLHHSLVN